MSTPTGGSVATPRPLLTVLAWSWVIVPFGYGLCQLLVKIPALFGN